jgi:hypothetical protein
MSGLTDMSDTTDIPWSIVRTDDAAVKALADALIAAIEIHLRRRGKGRVATIEALHALSMPAALMIASQGPEQAVKLGALYLAELAANLRRAGPIVAGAGASDLIGDLPPFLGTGRLQ